jgi:diguanylate cyclase (GGDEF)-like protein
VTVSIGVAACPSGAKSERELYASSDAALYRAKREGRNLVVLAGGETQAQTLNTNSVSAAGD